MGVAAATIAWGTIALYAAAAASVVGTGIGIYSSMASAENQANIAKAQQRQKEIEAQIAKDNATFEAGQSRRRAVLAMGRQNSIYAAAGLDPSGGSPLAMAIDQTQQMEIEALNIERTGKNTGASLQYEANVAKYRANLARGVVPYEIAGAITQGVGGVSSSYLSYGTTQRVRVPQKKTALSQMAWDTGY